MSYISRYNQQIRFVWGGGGGVSSIILIVFVDGETGAETMNFDWKRRKKENTIWITFSRSSFFNGSIDPARSKIHSFRSSSPSTSTIIFLTYFYSTWGRGGGWIMDQSLDQLLCSAFLVRFTVIVLGEGSFFVPLPLYHSWLYLFYGENDKEPEWICLKKNQQNNKKSNPSQANSFWFPFPFPFLFIDHNGKNWKRNQKMASPSTINNTFLSTRKPGFYGTKEQISCLSMRNIRYWKLH